MKRFTEEHEWVEIRSGVAVVGISSHAAQELGDMTFVELPEVDVEFAQGDNLCVVESVKAASDVYAPITGTVCEVNNSLEGSPEKISESPEDEGWICKMKPFKETDIEGLMTEEEYTEYVS